MIPRNVSECKNWKRIGNDLKLCNKMWPDGRLISLRTHCKDGRIRSTVAWLGIESWFDRSYVEHQFYGLDGASDFEIHERSPQSWSASALGHRMIHRTNLNRKLSAVFRILLVTDPELEISSLHSRTINVHTIIVQVRWDFFKQKYNALGSYTKGNC